MMVEDTDSSFSEHFDDTFSEEKEESDYSDKKLFSGEKEEGKEEDSDYFCEQEECLSEQNEGGKKRFPCPIEGCHQVLSRQDRLATHLHLHSKIKPYECNRHGCSIAYASRNSLRRHIKSKHQSVAAWDALPPLFCCPVDDCSAAFQHKQSVVRHVRKIHGGDKHLYIKCTECNAKFKKHSRYKEHMYEHNGTKSFKCQFPGCEEMFAKIVYRKAHEKKHKGYSCEKCEEAVVFPSWSELQSHKKTEHPKERPRNFKCPELDCSRRYTRSKYLKQHIAVYHHGERFKCPHCDRSLATKQKLNLHIQTYHEGDNPKPLPKKRQKPRWKKPTPEEKEERKLIRLAEQLSGVKKVEIPMAEDIVVENCVLEPKKREGQ